MTDALKQAQFLSVDSLKEQCCQKPCGHVPSWDDEDGVCRECVSDASEPVEFSRTRTERRRSVSGRILRGKSPVEAHHDQKRGKWFPVSACGIVPWGPGMSLEQRLSGKIDRLGIFRCGSIWTCPACAQRIAVARSAQVRAVIENAREMGFRVSMTTYTMPHDKCVPLATSIARVRDAMRRFAADGSARRSLAELGYVGHVATLEITLALDEDKHDNGWHVHVHDIRVYEGAGEDTTAKQDAAWAAEVKRRLFDPWSRAAVAAGSPRPPSFRHGLDVRVVWNATDYTVKLPEHAKAKDDAGKKRWGAENEITKTYIKERSEQAKSRAPFQLLDSDKPRDAELFVEYAKATFGRSQLEWSRGKRDLRILFLKAVDQRSDEELALADPDWEFADEVEESEPHADFVLEHIDIAAADAWRARRYGQGSLDRACALTEACDVLSLADALQLEGWTIIKHRDGFHAPEVNYDIPCEPVTSYRYNPAIYTALWPSTKPDA